VSMTREAVLRALLEIKNNPKKLIKVLHSILVYIDKPNAEINR
jgi:hypothetical protein